MNEVEKEAIHQYEQHYGLGNENVEEEREEETTFPSSSLEVEGDRVMVEDGFFLMLWNLFWEYVNQLKLLAYKNVLVSWRGKYSLVLELLCPSFFVLLLFLFGLASPKTEDKHPAAFALDGIPRCPESAPVCSEVFFAPTHNEMVQSIMVLYGAQNHLAFTPVGSAGGGMSGFSDVDSLQSYLQTP